MSGRAVIAGNKLTFGLIASTKIYCEELMDIEQKYEAARPSLCASKKAC